ncbi:MAG: hypothetical protein AB3N24_21345 [Leisingera sp.]
MKSISPFFKPLLLAILFPVFGGASAYFSARYAYENLDIGTETTWVIFTSLCVLLTAVFSATINSGSEEEEEGDKSITAIQSEIQSAKNQRMINGALCTITAVFSIFATTQAISTTVNNTDYLGTGFDIVNTRRTEAEYFFNKVTSYSNSLEENSNIWDEERVSKQQNLIRHSQEQYEKSVKALQEAEDASRKRPEAEVTTGFLFKFFSELFVRIATISIFLLLFGVTLRQYRKNDHAISELNTIKRSILIAKNSTQGKEIREIRDALTIGELQADKTEADLEAAHSKMATRVVEEIRKNTTELAKGGTTGEGSSFNGGKHSTQ